MLIGANLAALVLAMALICLAGCSGTSAVTSGSASSPEEDSSSAPSAGTTEQASSAEARSSGASASASASSTSSSANDASVYIGVWKGELTSASKSPTCYGAEEQPIEIEVLDVDSKGKMKLNVKVLFHGHAKSNLKSDINTHDGDMVQEWDDLTATLSGGKFKIVVEEPDIADARDLVIEGKFIDDSKSGKNLDVTVTSGTKADNGSMIPFTDTFTLRNTIGV